MAYIEFKDVDKIYKMGEVDLKALDKANFEIEKGELVVILGQSGSGKSTYEKNIGKHIINTQYLKFKDLSKENEITSNIKNKNPHILSIVSIANAKTQAETLLFMY